MQTLMNNASEKWERSLPSEEQVPRSILGYQEEVQEIELHAFGDASTQGVEAAVYTPLSSNRRK